MSWFTITAYSQDSLIVKSVYFGGGSYLIDQVQLDEIKIFINQIDHIEHFEIAIFSHTDNIGGKEYNKWLSKMRGQMVFKELLKADIPSELIKIKALGLDNPLYTNYSHSGRVMNRRVDIILSPIVF